MVSVKKRGTWLLDGKVRRIAYGKTEDEWADKRCGNCKEKPKSREKVTDH